MKDKILRLCRENAGLGLFIVLMVIFRSSLADWNTVPTGSMKPTILEGDRILVNKLAYDLRIPLTHIPIVHFADPRRGDIVVFDSDTADKRLVKRVIGLPGDVVAMRNNRLIINGVEAAYSDMQDQGATITAMESFADFHHEIKVNKQLISPLSSFGPVTVPDGHYLVLGDNRDNSADSRVHGFVPRREIVGRSREVVVSFNYDNYYLPRADRFFHDL